MKKVSKNGQRSAPKKRTAAGHLSRTKADPPLVDAVRRGLQHYADRGILSGFKETKLASGKVGFEFNWLYDRAYNLVADPAKGELCFNRMLPAITTKSEQFAILSDFVETLQNGELPEYRGLDPKRAKVTIASRQGFLSLTLAVKKKEYDYGVNRVINATHELLTELHQTCYDYMVEYLNVPEE